MSQEMMEVKGHHVESLSSTGMALLGGWLGKDTLPTLQGPRAPLKKQGPSRKGRVTLKQGQGGSACLKTSGTALWPGLTVLGQRDRKSVV